MFEETGYRRISNIEKLSLDLEVRQEGGKCGEGGEVTPKDPFLANRFVFLISVQGVDVKI